MSSPNDFIDIGSLPLLADHLRRGGKSVAHWKCGLEMELFGFRQSSLERIDASEVQAVLASFAKEQDRRYYEKDTLTELCVENLGHVTIEPGGQIEFSGREKSSLTEMASDLSAFLTRLKEVAEQRNLIFLAAGFDPLRGIAEQRWFPKRRYNVLRPHLASTGSRGWDMMTRTCAIQVSLDFDSESDWSKKFLLGNRLAPIITAIFANSPFAEGNLSGYKSTRAAAWLQTDDARCGLAPLALKDFVSFEDYVDYTLRAADDFHSPRRTLQGRAE
ncbi:MAG: glutamate-cysteine ligase family protein [Pyrinomonadaceae bacterium]